MPESDPPRSFGAPADDLIPDPSFWGPNRAAEPGRHRRRRPPGVAERITAAIPNRDARTAIAAVVAVLTVTTVLVSYRTTVPGGARRPPPGPRRRLGRLGRWRRHPDGSWCTWPGPSPTPVSSPFPAATG